MSTDAAETWEQVRVFATKLAAGSGDVRMFLQTVPVEHLAACLQGAVTEGDADSVRDDSAAQDFTGPKLSAMLMLRSCCWQAVCCAQCSSPVTALCCWSAQMCKHCFLKGCITPTHKFATYAQPLCCTTLSEGRHTCAAFW